ncbi:MAG: pyridoxal-phosphate dependent enzyme [Deltaproteobacteria bacterium]|nr:pyridoxal-phosphate dependent enzyme [Deltaproteobacteria bacterium]
MINLAVNEKIRDANAKFCKEKGITLPTFKMMRDPVNNVPEKIKEKLGKVGLWDINPLNLYRITWKNQQKDVGGGFGEANSLLFPSELTGCKAKIIGLSGRWFPTGAHKVGATFGCLVPKLITGQFDPVTTKAVWPSTGNFCRGGAYVATLLGCSSIAILPEEMSSERFEWLKSVSGEVIATPGCESNVKEIFDKCWELRKSGEKLDIFNQFEEMGNPLWHYNVTGPAIKEVLERYATREANFAGSIFSSGSAGTLGAGYYLKKFFPKAKLAAAEALQCPTLLHNGYGGHRIEGIGDKHVPWVHDAKNVDMNIAVDDEQTIRLVRLFNEKEGRKVLIENGISEDLVKKLNLLGISGIGNLIAAIKFAKYYELTEKDYVVTVLTDSMQLYASRVKELKEERGEYTEKNAHKDLELLHNVTIDYLKELTYYDKKAVHNLKYFTWIEQQGRELQELNDQWYDHSAYWNNTLDQVEEIDELIVEFNERIGL